MDKKARKRRQNRESQRRCRNRKKVSRSDPNDPSYLPSVGEIGGSLDQCSAAPANLKPHHLLHCHQWQQLPAAEPCCRPESLASGPSDNISIDICPEYWPLITTPWHCMSTLGKQSAPLGNMQTSQPGSFWMNQSNAISWEQASNNQLDGMGTALGQPADLFPFCHTPSRAGLEVTLGNAPIGAPYENGRDGPPIVLNLINNVYLPAGTGWLTEPLTSTCHAPTVSEKSENGTGNCIERPACYKRNETNVLGLCDNQGIGCYDSIRSTSG
ncbi:hypothetical protein PG987_004241 [Apiospora arundinis]